MDFEKLYEVMENSNVIKVYLSDLSVATKLRDDLAKAIDESDHDKINEIRNLPIWGGYYRVSVILTRLNRIIKGELKGE